MIVFYIVHDATKYNFPKLFFSSLSMYFCSRHRFSSFFFFFFFFLVAIFVFIPGTLSHFLTVSLSPQPYSPHHIRTALYLLCFYISISSYLISFPNTHTNTNTNIPNKYPSHLTNTNNFTHSMHSTYCKTACQQFCKQRESQRRFSTSPLPNVRRLWQSSTE